MGQIGMFEFVYFITDGTAIKIGYSAFPKDRLRTLQSAHHAALWIIDYAPGTMGDEARLHEKFADIRLGGEWFQSAPELLAFIPKFCCARKKIEAVRNELAAWARDKSVQLNRLVRILDGGLRSLADDPDQPQLRRTVVMTIEDLRRAAAGIRSAA